MKAVIFDLDGVIVSTDGLHYQAWKEIADREHIYFDEQINRRLRGVSRMQSLDIILEKAARSYTDSEKEELAGKKNEIYRELLGTLTPADIMEGAEETIRSMQQAGLKTGIGSSSKNTKLVLERIGLANAFDAVCDGNCITHSKPHPEVFLKCAEMLDVDPADCVVVEDAAAGIQAAKAAGMTAAAIGDARNCTLSDIRLDTLKDLCKLVSEES